uniref:phosphatidylinositol-3,5-bisphosphate 3-phosphatase n=1 Tax=Hirondellea gigas TaxID=1518452 RepID=A0A6A7FTA9_9CRUS
MQPHDTGGGDDTAVTQQEPSPPLDKVIQLRESECQYEHGASAPLPFMEIAGEEVRYVSTLPEHGLLAMSNYRIILQKQGRLHHVPLGLLDSIIMSNDNLSLQAMCKDAKSYTFKLHSTEHCSLWMERLQEAAQPMGDLEKSFAYKFYTQTKDFYSALHKSFISCQVTGLPSIESTYELRAEKLFDMELSRQKFDVSSSWRVTSINLEYGMCGSYPRRLVIPSCISEKTLQEAAQHRSSKRIPAAVYRHRSNGAVLVRCSQPTVGILYWRSSQDEDIIKAIAEACDYDLTPLKHPLSKSLGNSATKTNITRKSAAALTKTNVEGNLPHPLYNGHLEVDDNDDTEPVVVKLSENDAAADNNSQVKATAHQANCDTEVKNNEQKDTPDLIKIDSITDNNNDKQVNASANNHVLCSTRSELDAKSKARTSTDNSSEQPCLNEQIEPGTRSPTSDIQSLYDMPEARQQKDIKKVLFVDARSYTNAVANRARGGGFEYPEYYMRSDIQFMNLENIHTVRKMLQTLGGIVANLPDTTNWMSSVEGSRWLVYMSNLLKAAVIVCRAIAMEGRPVVVHCSDGWDRTPQITALAQIMLDPYYRTLEGFEVLVEREWLEFGHKFSDRCGSGGSGSVNASERCPVFLQWLDSVHQLLHQFPQAFQFNQAYLVKLSQHVYSNLFGTFLCNTSQERAKNKLLERTYPVWAIFTVHTHRYINFFYASTQRVLYPACHTKDLKLWDAVYRSTTMVSTDEVNLHSSSMQPTTPNPHPEPSADEMALGELVKTRSCDDLTQIPQQTLIRHASDSNLIDSAPNIAMLSSALGSEILKDEYDAESIEMSSLDKPIQAGSSRSRCLSRDRERSTDTNVDKADMALRLCSKDQDLSDGEDTLDKLIPVCRCIEIEERKRNQCDCNNGVLLQTPESLSSGAVAGRYSCLPTELRGIPEASKKRSEVASEISKGNIEKAVEADENGMLNCDESDDLDVLTIITKGIEDLKIDPRMLKSESDICDALLCNSLRRGCCDGSVVKGSTDTLVYEGNVCDNCCNGADLNNCSLHASHDHHHRSSTNACLPDEEIVEHLMRKKLQQQQNCYKKDLIAAAIEDCPGVHSAHASFVCSAPLGCLSSTSNNCSVCLTSSKLITDLDNIVNNNYHPHHSNTNNIHHDVRRNCSATTVASSANVSNNLLVSVAELTLPTLASSMTTITTLTTSLTTSITTSMLGKYLPNGGSNSAPNGSAASGGSACGSVVGDGSCSGSRAASSKSTPGHSRTPSAGYMPHAAATDEERGVYSRSSSTSSGSSSSGGGAAVGGGGGVVAWSVGGCGGVDGVGEVTDNVQVLVHHLLAQKEAEVLVLRDSLALSQRALQQQLQHTTHHCGNTARHCTGAVAIPHAAAGTHDQFPASESMSSTGSNGLESAGAMSDTSWEALGEDSIISGSMGASVLPAGISWCSGEPTGLGPAGSVPPGVTIMGRAPTLWVPDHTAHHCHNCHAKFWAGLRRHHCRSCGGVFCSKCSGQSAAVPREHFYHPVRVCESCYSTLHPHNTTFSTTTTSTTDSTTSTNTSNGLTTSAVIVSSASAVLASGASAVFATGASAAACGASAAASGASAAASLLQSALGAAMAARKDDAISGVGIQDDGGNTTPSTGSLSRSTSVNVTPTNTPRNVFNSSNYSGVATPSQPATAVYNTIEYATAASSSSSSNNSSFCESGFSSINSNHYTEATSVPTHAATNSTLNKSQPRSNVSSSLSCSPTPLSSCKSLASKCSSNTTTSTGCRGSCSKVN